MVFKPAFLMASDIAMLSDWEFLKNEDGTAIRKAYKNISSKKALAIRIYCDFLDIVLNDVIDNDVIYKFCNNRYSYIHIGVNYYKPTKKKSFMKNPERKPYREFKHYKMFYSFRSHFGNLCKRKIILGQEMRNRVEHGRNYRNIRNYRM